MPAWLFPRSLGILIILLAAAVAALGYPALRRDAGLLDPNSRGAMMWWGANTEIELLRFELSISQVQSAPNDRTIGEARHAFDVLWSRLAMIGTGVIGERLRGREGVDPILELRGYLREIDPVVAGLRVGDGERVADMLRRLRAFHQPIRLYTLEVMQEDQRVASDMRRRIAWSARAVVLISGIALLVAFLALVLLARENRAQRKVTELSRKAARAAELASRAKSRFLTMMSHELRNPLNGVIGPLALLSQSEIGPRQRRLVEQASQSAHAMSQMVGSLLDYGEIQDGSFETKSETLRMSALADLIRSQVAASTGVSLTVRIAENTPPMMLGDANRVCQIFVSLAEFFLESCDPEQVSLDFAHAEEQLTGEMKLRGGSEADWKRMDLLLELNPLAPDGLTADALRPMIARGLVSALRGEFELGGDAAGEARSIRVTLPAREMTLRRVRVFLDTRSKTLAAIYRAALRSDDVIFEEASTSGAVDLVLVDAARAESETEIATLRERHPEALFVSLGLPGSPGSFDEVVEQPNDFDGLRAKIMRRLAS